MPITAGPLTVYTSNIFATLVLGAMYSALTVAIHCFRHLKHVLPRVSVFNGSEICYSRIFGKMDASIPRSLMFALPVSGVIYLFCRTPGRTPSRVPA